MDRDSHLIFESYKNIFQNLLLENAQKAIEIKNKYFPKLSYSNDPSVILTQFVTDSTVERIYNVLAEHQVAKTSYLNWIFLLMQNRVPRVLEDLETIAKNLKIFNSKTSKIAADGHPTQLFNQQTKELIYKKPQDLYNVVSNYIETDDVGERQLLKKGAYLASKGEADKIYEDENFVVYNPKTYEASKELACFSNWCTRFPDMYKNYSKQGPLYIIYDKFKLGENLFNKQLEGDEKDDNRMIQFHLPSKQFKNIKDREVKDRREFMNSLKGLYDTLFPNALNEFVKVSKGEMDREDLSPEAKRSLYIMPSDYREELNIPCDEIQEKIARELGVDCRDVEESDHGYVVGDAEYAVESVAHALENAIYSLQESGIDDEWYINNIVGGKYSWDNVYNEEDFEDRKFQVVTEAFFHDENDFKELYQNYFKEFFDKYKDYTEEEIEKGSFINDLEYDDFIGLLENSFGSDPVKYYVEQLGRDLHSLEFIEWDKLVRDWFESPSMHEDRIGQWVSSYDGEAYYFNLDGEEMIMYRID